MSENKLRTFLNNPGNQILVFCCTTVLSMLCISPFATAYLEARSERVHSDTVAAQLEQLKTSVDQLDVRLQETQAEAKDLRSRAVSENDVEEFRNTLMELVRKADCRLRGLNVGEQAARRWMEGDDALSGADHFDTAEFDPVPTDYLLHTQNIDLVVSGRFEGVNRLLTSIQRLGRLAHTRSLDIQKEAHNEIRLHWSLGLCSLSYVPNESEDDWDEGLE